MAITPEQILRFWFVEAGPAEWYAKTPEFDATVSRRFAAAHREAAAGLHDGWREDALGCVALCILLDQFPRNMFRGSARAFADDRQALAVTRHALDCGFDRDRRLDDARRGFLYLPLEHSENIADQRRCLDLAVSRMNDRQFVDYARRHLEIIERFGRFPHRNHVLGRRSTLQETAFLSEDGSGF